MKKRLIISLIASLLIASLIGGAFALYKKDATNKTVELTAGDAVVLSLSESAVFNITGLSPESTTNNTATVTLAASNSDKIEADKHGSLKVTIVPYDESNSVDVALSKAITYTATDGVSYNPSQALLAVGDDSILLSALPGAITFTFSVPETGFASIAEGKVKVVFEWKAVNTVWNPTAGTYYLVSSANGWVINKVTPVLATDSPIKGDNTAAVANVEFAAGTEFKVVKGNKTEWYDCAGGESTNVGDVAIGTATTNNAGNAVVKTAGKYNVYYKEDVGFYVGPGDNGTWDGKFTVDVSAVSWFEGDGCVPYIYIWYSDAANDNDGAYPGTAMTKSGSVYTYTVNVPEGKSVAGVKIARGKVVNGSVQYYNELKNNITAFSITHTIVITEDMLQEKA